MRFISIILFTTLVACAHTPTAGSVNVAAVRHEIGDTIHGDRAIVSMGHVERDRAIVYTRDAGNARHEETWVRGDSGWKLTATTAVATSAP